MYSRKIINFFSELIIFYFPYIHSCHLLFHFSFLLYNIHINVYIFKSKVVSYNIPRCLTRTNNLQFNLRLMTRLIADTSVILKFTVVRIFNDIVCACTNNSYVKCIRLCQTLRRARRLSGENATKWLSSTCEIHVERDLAMAADRRLIVETIAKFVEGTSYAQ